ncbi:MAG: flavodoxin-dependent (E)-4-hydroxy-3-methylbut-2-enyl-diphosphate synthase, partial [Elusimicrobia bacterium]|nr:flavodoxin-dependent (E)-4-hydroxy-3-methylbut-2-enyl-diphosphate synthase [Elusimicrobiota bacterium]
MTAARTVKIGRYTIGGGNPVRVQTMCNTDTRDVSATVRQILLLERAGCEINRVAVPDMSTAKNLGKIKKRINSPLVADIHFDHRLALEAVKQGVDKIRINPGNIGSKEKVREVAKACADRKIPIRIGVNAGSLKEHKIFRNAKECARAMVRAALEEVSALEDMGFRDIVVSLKADDIERTVLACRMFAQKSDIPLHLGITEAGSFLPGVVKSAIGLGALLADGI